MAQASLFKMTKPIVSDPYADYFSAMLDAPIFLIISSYYSDCLFTIEMALPSLTISLFLRLQP